MKFGDTKTMKQLGGALLVVLLGCGRPATPPTAVTTPPDTTPVVVAAPVAPSGLAPSWGVTLGQYVADHPDEELLVAAPGTDERVALGGTSDGVPGVWCARASLKLMAAEERTAWRRSYFFLVAPDSAPPGPGSSAAAIRAQYCRLGLVGLEVAPSGRDPESAARLLDSLTGAVTVGPVLIRHRGEVWRDGPAGCLDAKYGFYGPAGNTVRCQALFAIDSATAVTKGLLAHGRADELSRGTDAEFLRAQSGSLSARERGMLDSLLDAPAGITTHAPTDTVPIDSQFVRTLIAFRDAIRARPPADRALGWALLDVAFDRGVKEDHFGWPPISRFSRGYEFIGNAGGQVEFSESDFDWLYYHNWLDSAESAHRPDALGDSLYMWAVGSSSGCAPWGGERFSAVIGRSRPYTAPTRSRALRIGVWQRIAGWWADSVFKAPAGQVPGLRDSMVTALEEVMKLHPDSGIRRWGNDALWRARAGLLPLSPQSTCEYVD